MLCILLKTIRRYYPQISFRYRCRDYIYILYNIVFLRYGDIFSSDVIKSRIKILK